MKGFAGIGNWSFRHPQRPWVASGIPLDRGRCPYGRNGLGMTEKIREMHEREKTNH